MTTKNKNMKKVCRCENCGNEAEMNITCSWEDFEQQEQQKAKTTDSKNNVHQVKGTATCSHCGNEADMWIDI